MMRYWRDPESDVEYRVLITTGKLLIDRKKITDPVWKRCCNIPRVLFEAARELNRHF